MRIFLNEGWQMTWEPLSSGPNDSNRVRGKKVDWLETDLPCDVHMPLIEHGIISEPLLADQCFSSEWTENCSWWFKKIFTLSEEQLAADRIEITFESLDAEADIWINNHHLGHHRSAFYPFACDLQRAVHVGDNLLLVRVSSGVEHYSKQDIALTYDSAAPQTNELIGVRGDERRVMVRKPQYVYGWDWGPRVATCGMVKNVRIDFISEMRLHDVHAVTVSVDTSRSNPHAQLQFRIELENLHPFKSIEAQLKVELLDESEKVALVETERCLRSGLNYIMLQIEVPNAKLWWPNGMGRQSLYTVRVSAETGDKLIEFPVFQYGIRTLRLNTEKWSAPGTDVERRFTFEVNGVQVFSKGGNWIPADSIYTRVTDEKYDILLREASEANFNMLRIWGGGIYERDIFYEKCDLYGILLWHDFMFACAKYPDHLAWFRDEVERELDYQTRRLRNHCSLALWCGNNENHWGFDEWWRETEVPDFYGGAVCYNEIAPRIVERNCPEIPYWNSSPYGGEHPNGSDSGDRHHWSDCMMNPDMEKRITPEEFDKVSAKFVSEYGYIGSCRKSTIEKYHNGQPLDRNSKVWQLHNNTFEKDTVLAGIKKHYVETEHLNIDEYLLYAGLCQGLMYCYSLESFRSKPFCSGALFWMYNDCWGEVGWSIIDYYLTRKISYYFVKRALDPVKLILREQDGLIRLTAINETSETIKETLAYGLDQYCREAKDGSRKNDIRKENMGTGTCQLEVILPPHSRKILHEWKADDYDPTRSFYYVKPIREHSRLKSAILWKVPFRSVTIPEASLTVFNVRRDSDCIRFTVASDAFAHAVHFGLDEHLHLSDEYFDLLPGERRDIVLWTSPESNMIDKIVPKYIKNH